EATELFVRAVGEASDIVSKEMFTFKDRGDRSLTLRPEGTAPIVRAYFDAGMQLEPQPVRLYYLGPYFRSERPQRGRFHEFRQFGIEAIGDPSPLLDVEAIVLGWSWFGALDTGGIHLLLNSIGDEVCRPAYRELVRGLDYYTRTVFEYQHESLGGAQNALGGGGRYDGLAAALGYRTTPGVGFAIGLDRTAMVLRERKPLAPPVPDVWALAVDPKDELYIFHLAGTLRARGLRVVVDPGAARLDAKLRKAAKRGARVALLVGPEEREKGEAVVRD